jgi:hypothetical protein
MDDDQSIKTMSDKTQIAPLDAPTCSPFTVMKFSQIASKARKHEERMDSIFDHDEKLGYITINAAYPYHIELSRIPDHEGLVHWLEHLTGKPWMTSDLVGEFIRRVYAIKGWNLYRRDL